MKKLLVALLAFTTATAALADHGSHTMIRLDNCFDGTCDGLDFDWGGNDEEDAELATMNIALNYAYSFGSWGVGATLAKQSSTQDGDIRLGAESSNTMTIGISGYYNVHGSWDDSCFFGLHYTQETAEDADKNANGTADTTVENGYTETKIGLEYGHRFKIGSLGKINFNWSPSVSYWMTTNAPNADGSDDLNTTSLTINPVNFAMTY